MEELKITRERAIRRMEWILKHEIYCSDKLSHAAINMAITALRSTEPENKVLITVEQVQEFYEFLQGNIPYNDAQKITFTKPPKVSKETAVDIIYYLQEVAHIIPDTYESCKKCGDFFDSDNDGCLAGFCECCGCQHPEFVEQEDGCVKCEESLYARKPEGSDEP